MKKKMPTLLICYRAKQEKWAEFSRQFHLNYQQVVKDRLIEPRVLIRAGRHKALQKDRPDGIETMQISGNVP